MKHETALLIEYQLRAHRNEAADQEHDSDRG